MIKNSFSHLKRKTFVILLVFLGVISTVRSYTARGWGDHIDWKTLEDGNTEAKNSQKPLMLLVHKSWCGACKALKPKFSTSPDIADLAKNFVMVNVEDEEEPKDPQFHIDGSYIPRIFFLDSSGNVFKDIINSDGNPSYKYFYSNADAIVSSMKKALNKMAENVDHPKSDHEL